MDRRRTAEKFIMIDKALFKQRPLQFRNRSAIKVMKIKAKKFFEELRYNR
jgi:hypothetical protein